MLYEQIVPAVVSDVVEGDEQAEGGEHKAHHDLGVPRDEHGAASFVLAAQRASLASLSRQTGVSLLIFSRGGMKPSAGGTAEGAAAVVAADSAGAATTAVAGFLTAVPEGTFPLEPAAGVVAGCVVAEDAGADGAGCVVAEAGGVDSAATAGFASATGLDRKSTR